MKTDEAHNEKNMENQKKNENIKAMLKERRLKIIEET